MSRYAVCLVALILLTGSPSRAQSISSQYPLGAVRSKDGTTFVVDRKLPGVLNLVDGKLSVLTQGSKTFRTPLNAPRCIALDKDGNVLVGDSATRDVYRIDSGGKAKPLTGGKIGIPMAIAVNAAGELFIADLELHRIFKVAAAGGDPEDFATIAAPRGLAFDNDGNLLVLSTTENQVFRVSPEGQKEILVPGRPFRFPHNLAAAADGSIFVTDSYGKCIWKISGDGKPEKLVSGDPLSNPVGLSMSGTTLLVVDSRANTVFECDLSGNLTKLLPAE